jgi:hypothetical protein
MRSPTREDYDLRGATNGFSRRGLQRFEEEDDGAGKRGKE